MKINVMVTLTVMVMLMKVTAYYSKQISVEMNIQIPVLLVRQEIGVSTNDWLKKQ